MPTDQAPLHAARGPIEPGVLQSVRFLLDPVAHSARLRDRYGPVTAVKIVGTGDLLLVTRPDLVKKVISDRKTFENYSGDEILAPVIGPHGVILLTGERHLERRKVLTPPFHGQQLARWTDTIAEVAAEELAKLPLDKPLSIRPTMQRITVDVICRVVFGVDDPETLARFSVAVARWSNPRFALPLMFPLLRIDLGPLSPWGGLLRARADMHELLDEAIATARSRPDLNERDDVLSMLLRSVNEDGSLAYTDDELRDELLGLLFAGHDTTASALAWSCVMLADHPEAWDRLVAETAEGSHAWTDAVSKETLRLRPSVMAAGRYALVDTELDGVAVPAGTRLGTLTVAGFDEENFTDAGAYRPERWLADPPPKSIASTPFGGGVHRCIGEGLANLEMRVVLQELARRTPSLNPAPGLRDRHTSFSAVLVPSRGGRVVLASK